MRFMYAIPFPSLKVDWFLDWCFENVEVVAVWTVSALHFPSSFQAFHLTACIHNCPFLMLPILLPITTITPPPLSTTSPPTIFHLILSFPPRQHHGGGGKPSLPLLVAPVPPPPPLPLPLFAELTLLKFDFRACQGNASLSAAFNLANFFSDLTCLLNADGYY
jgi:hypothetical protein